MANNNNNIFGLKNLPKNVAPGANIPTGNLLRLNNAVAPITASANADANIQNLFTPYEVGFFLDNDYKYIMQVGACAPKVTVHKVAGQDHIIPTPVGGPQYKSYMLSMSSVGKEFGSAIAALMALQGPRGVAYEEMIDFGSGIAPRDITVLKTWLAENAARKKAVLIDYDRTLTQIEGSYMLGNSMEQMRAFFQTYKLPSDGLTVEGFLEYYCGGTERVDMLQKMFDDIYNTPNTTVFILTNNPACHKYVGFFTDIIKALTRGREFGLLCSSLTQGNKKRAIEQGGPTIRALCTAAGGRRRGKKKTRRHIKKRKVTHRR